MPDDIRWPVIDATIRRIIAERISTAGTLAICWPMIGRAAGILDSLNIPAEVDHLAQWLGSLLQKEPPPENIVAFMFGIVNLAYGRGGSRTDLYLCGSDDFDPEDEDCEWAVGPVYFPEGRYAASTAMWTLNEAGTLGPRGASELLTGAFAAAAVREACDLLGPGAILRTDEGISVPGRAIAAGHDSGGGWVLGVLTEEGWENTKDCF